MKFSGKMCLRGVTKNQRFTLSLEDTFFEKPQGASQIDPLPSFLWLMSEIALIDTLTMSVPVSSLVVPILSL